ncbi:MAG: lytic murein transglycosylase [Candidatus Binatia bacterium]|jgi:membrane-bound lytic murein transglycosylase B
MWRRIVVWVLLSAVGYPAAASADERGWEYLIDKLAADGVSRERAFETFHDPRVRPFSGLEFSINAPREPRSRYRRLLRPVTITAARRCRARYAAAFEDAERAHGVPASLLAAVLFVESTCGHNTGSYVVFTRLARLAMANAPDNVARNLARFSDGDGTVRAPIEALVRDRARELERTFYPELRALFTVADRMGIGVFNIRGSSAGAFGYPQFLPTSYLEDGIDADGDGRVSLYDFAAAAASCARYLVRHGWHAGLTRAEQRAVVWQYNHSDAYVDAVLTLAARIDNAPAPVRSMMAARKRKPHRASVRRAAHHRSPRHAAPKQLSS